MMRSNDNYSIHKQQAAAYYLSFFSFGLIISIIGPALPFLAVHTSVSLDRAALLFTMSSIGFFTGSLISGQLYDRYPGNRVLAGAWTISATAAFFIPVITSFPLLSLVIMSFGFANGSIVVGCNSLITRVDPARTPQLMNVMHIVNGVGAFITPLFFSLIISRTADVITGYRTYSPLFLLLAIFVLLTPSPKHTSEQTDTASPSTPSTAPRPVTAAPYQPITPPEKVFVLLLTLNTLIYVGSEISFNGWIFTYTRTLFPGADQQAGFINSAFFLFMTTGRVLALFTVRRIQPRNLLLLHFFGAAAGLILIIYGPVRIQTIWTGTIITGISMGAVFPLLMSFTQRQIGLTGRISGIVFAGTSIGGMIFPFLNGQIFIRYSPQAVMVSILITISLGLTIFLLLRKYAKTLNQY